MSKAISQYLLTATLASWSKQLPWYDLAREYVYEVPSYSKRTIGVGRSAPTTDYSLFWPTLTGNSVYENPAGEFKIEISSYIGLEKSSDVYRVKKL